MKNPLLASKAANITLPLIICLVLLAACSATDSTKRLRPDIDPTEEISLRGVYPYKGPLPEFSTPVTIEELRLAYYKYSPRLIMEALREESRINWDFILSNIAAGDKDWIAATGYFTPGLYGHGSGKLELNRTLAVALGKNPEAVLWLETGNPGMSLEYLCNNIINLNDYTGEPAPDHAQKSIKAMQKVDNPYLNESRDTCIRRVENELAIWERMKDEECTY